MKACAVKNCWVGNCFVSAEFPPPPSATVCSPPPIKKTYSISLSGLAIQVVCWLRHHVPLELCFLHQYLHTDIWRFISKQKLLRLKLGGLAQLKILRFSFGSVRLGAPCAFIQFLREKSTLQYDMTAYLTICRGKNEEENRRIETKNERKKQKNNKINVCVKINIYLLIILPTIAFDFVNWTGQFWKQRFTKLLRWNGLSNFLPRNLNIPKLSTSPSYRP